MIGISSRTQLALDSKEVLSSPGCECKLIWRFSQTLQAMFISYSVCKLSLLSPYACDGHNDFASNEIFFAALINAVMSHSCLALWS